MEFNEILRILRRKSNLRQEDLAEKLEIDRTVISDWENKISTPQYNQLMEIAESFDISLDELTGRLPNKDIARYHNLEQKCKSDGYLTIADLRHEFGMSIQELAQLLGIARNTLTNWEAKGLPNFGTYKKIFEVFDLSIDLIKELK